MRFGMRAIVCAGVVALVALAVWEPIFAAPQRAQLSAQACSDVLRVTGTQRAIGDQPNDYCLRASGPGVLTVVVRGATRRELDLYIEVLDDFGEIVFEGSADSDLDGRFDAEQLAVTLPWAGTYTIRVGNYGERGESGNFYLGASWIQIDGLIDDSGESDNRPDGANELPIGQHRSASVDPYNGDPADWWYVRNGTKGLIVVNVSTTAEYGDLVLEGYRRGGYGEPLAYSDNDLGALGNESISLELAAGEVVHIVVRPLTVDEGEVVYRISAGRESLKRPD